MLKKTKKAKEYAANQKTKTQDFIKIVEQAIESESKFIEARNEKWSSENIVPLIEERKSFKAELDNKPMVELVDQAPQLLDKVKDMSTTQVP